MDRQKVIPPVSTKITRKLASESNDHKDVMNYYSSISSDETGAPVKWKMSGVHEEILPGRGSPALAKIARSRSNSRDSSSERKKLNQESEQNKNSSRSNKILSKRIPENQIEKVCILENESSAGNEVIREKEKDEIPNIDKGIKVKKKGRTKSEPATVMKKEKRTIITKTLNKNVSVLKKKRGRPKSLGIQNKGPTEPVVNGEDDFFKSPHPLTPCNILVKPKKGRPKETPPTLEPEPFMSPNSQPSADIISGSLTEQEDTKRKPGRPPRKKHKSSDEASKPTDTPRNEVPVALNSQHDKLPTNRRTKPKVKANILAKGKRVLPLKSKPVNFKQNSTVNVSQSEKAQTVNKIKLGRKCGRPPGSKNKPKPVSYRPLLSKLRLNSVYKESKTEAKEESLATTSIAKIESTDMALTSTNDSECKIDKISSTKLNSTSVSGHDSETNGKLSCKPGRKKDPLRKGNNVSKGKVYPTSKTLKDTKSVPNVKRKRILASHAKKYSESTIANLPENDLRRKLHQKMLDKLSGRDKTRSFQIDRSKGNDLDATLPDFNQDKTQEIDIVSDVSSEQQSKTSPEVQNLSAMVESKRYTRIEKEISSEKARSKKNVRDKKEFGKLSDNESTCSEISSFSTVSNSSYQRYIHDKGTAVKLDEKINDNCANIRKKPGRKRKRKLSDEKKVEDVSNTASEQNVNVSTVIDFQTDKANLNRNSSVLMKKKKGRPKVQKHESPQTNTLVRVLEKNAKRTITRHRNMNMIKHLKRAKMSKINKPRLVKSEQQKLKKHMEIVSDETDKLSASEDGFLKQHLNVASKDIIEDAERNDEETVNYSDCVNSEFRFLDHHDETKGLHAKVSEVQFDMINDKKVINRPEKEMKENHLHSDLDTFSCDNDKETSQMMADSSVPLSVVPADQDISLTLREKDNEIYNEINCESSIDETDEHTVVSENNMHVKNSDQAKKTLNMVSESTHAYESENTVNNEISQEDGEIKMQEFSKSIIDKAKEISFEVSEKKKLLKEKILKGREFNKKFICKATDASKPDDEVEMLLPDSELEHNDLTPELLSEDSNNVNKFKESEKEGVKNENYITVSGIDCQNTYYINSNDSTEIVQEILISMVDKVCEETSLIAEKIKKDKKDTSVLSTSSDNADEKNIREYLGNIPDSVQSMKTLNLMHFGHCETEKVKKQIFDNRASDLKSVGYQIRKPVSNTDLIKRRKRLRKREKKSVEAGNLSVRKIELRQKISRSPLDNIALKQSIEENEYLNQQLKKTAKRSQKLKLKQSPTMLQSPTFLDDAVTEGTVSEQNDTSTEDNKDNSKQIFLYDDTTAVTVEDLLKECKPCSVVLKDFLKQLQMKSPFEDVNDSEDCLQKREVEEIAMPETKCEGTEKTFENELAAKKAFTQYNENEQSDNPQLSNKVEKTDCTESKKETSKKRMLSNADLKEKWKVLDFPMDSKNQKVAKKNRPPYQTNRNKVLVTGTKDQTREQMDHSSSEKNSSSKLESGEREPYMRYKKTIGAKKLQKALKPHAVREVSQTAKSVINKKGPTQRKRKINLSEKTVNEVKKQKVGNFDICEQTARKTVPPLKIKLQGGLTSKTKVYTVETTINTNSNSVDSALDNKPKKKFKSKSKSDSESEKRKSHHHAKKQKSTEGETMKNTDIKIAEPTKTDTLKAKDPYEATFLAFIKQQEKDESVTASISNWRSSVVAKANHQLIGGKACKSGADGALTVSACAVAETKTSSVSSDKFVTVSKSPLPSTTDGDVQSERETENAFDDKYTAKKTDIEHFQKTEKVVNNLVSKLPNRINYYCNHCKFLCESQNEIMEHTKSLHKDQLLYSCSICHKVRFKTKPAILAHFATCHEGMKGSYICLPDYYERPADTKEPKSPSDHADNIFDRMCTLLETESSKSEETKQVSSATDSPIISRTAVEADSTTSALDETDTPSSSVKASLVENGTEEEVTSAADQSGKDDQSTKDDQENSRPALDSSTADKADAEEGSQEMDNELNIKIVDVVSLKDQEAFSSENTVEDSPAAKSVEAMSADQVLTSTTSSMKHGELKVPFYPVSHIAKNTATVTPPSNVSVVNQVKKHSAKVGTTYKCEACQVHAPVLAALVAHLKNSHTNIPKLFQCPYCRDMEGENEALIHQHIRHCHPTDNPNPPVALSEPAKRNLKTLSVELPERAEGTAIERDIYMCLRCKKHLPSLEMIYNHLELEHKEVFVYVCPFCKVFKAKEEIIVNSHVLNVHCRSIDDINISLAIDGTQFVRVCSLIKDKSIRTGTKPITSQSQPTRPQAEPRPNLKSVSNLTIPFHQNMAPLHPKQVQLSPGIRTNLSQAQPVSTPQHSSPVRPTQLQGAKKRKATLSESIAQLTLQRQLQQAQQEANKQANNDSSQSGARPTMQQPPALLRGPPPLIRYDQLTKVPASLIAAQQYLQTGKINNAGSDQALPKVTSNILGQLTISAAERLQTLNNPKSHPNQLSAAPKPIQSALFDTSDPNSFIPVNRRPAGPVLNIPQIPRTSNRPPSQQESPVMQRNLITGSPLDLSNKSTPEPSPPADGKADDSNPEAFKIFNLQPSTLVQPQTNVVPQFVRPNTTSTLAYRPATPHIANMPVNAVNMVPISLGNISLQQMQNLPQFVRMNFPQGQTVQSQSLQQVLIPQTLQQVNPQQSVQQVVIPQTLQQVGAPQSVQQIIMPQSLQQVIASVSMAQTTASPQTDVESASNPKAKTTDDVQEKSHQGPMFKCPYCTQIVKLTIEEVKPHIEEKHPGSQIMLVPHM